ncbi:MAG TPA: MFS transporter [Burkholderiaceae bacterium]
MSQSNQFSLLGQRRFAPFFWTQFFGAFNDNVFKTALITALTFDAASWTTIPAGTLNNMIPGLFILPFVFLSATSGQLADKFDKARMARAVKVLEVVIMLIAGAGWFIHNLWLLIAAVVGMGIHSTIFGPVKYAYLPQHLKKDELVGGNAVIEAGTFVGIVIGEVLGVVLVELPGWGTELVAGATLGFALIGWAASQFIPVSPAADADLKINWNVFSESFRNLRFSSKNRPVFLSLLGNSWFWFYGAIMLAQFPEFAKAYLHGDHNVFVLLLAIFSVGIGAGSLLCEKLSGHKIEIGLVPMGSIGLTIFGADLYFAAQSYVNTQTVGIEAFLAQHGSWHILFDCSMIGVFGGFYVVPLFALIQTRCDPAHISRTIAGMNILNAIFMVVASLMAMVLLNMGATVPQLFLITAGLNALIAIYIFSLVPEFVMRFLAWILIHTIHSVRGVDTDRIPKEGAAVLVCNHVSYVDAIVIMAASPRPIRFVMDHRIFKIPVLAWIFRTAKAIPIAPAKEDPVMMEKAYDAIAQALQDGELVCIFPEGRLTQTGEMNEFKGGVKKIIDRTPVRVIPMALSGLWGSLLTRGEGNPFGRSFRRGPWSKLALAVGEAVEPADVTPELLRQKVLALRGDWK